MSKNKKKVSNLAIRSGIWFTVSNFLVKSIGFITTPIFTRLLTKTEFGDFNNFQTWIGILLIITSLNLEASLIRARFDYENDLDTYIFSMIILSSLSTITWIIIVNIFIVKFESLLAMNKLQIEAMLAYLLFYPPVVLFQNLERFKYKYKWTVASSIIISVGSSLLSVLFVVYFENKLAGRIIGYITPVIIIGIIIDLYYLKKSHKVRVSYWKYALPFTLPFIPHLLSMYLLGSMDKVMIKRMCGSEDLALYSLAYTVGTLITILVNSMNSAYSPWLGEQLSKNNYSRIKKLSIPYVLIFTYFSCGVVLVTPEILLILGGHTYMAAKYVMPPVAAGCLMQFIYCMYVNVEQYEKKTGGMAIASMIAALFNFVTNYIFIRKYGYIAAAYTTYFGYLVLLLMHMYLVKRIGKGMVYNNKAILTIAFSASVIIFLINLIFDMLILRYCILVLYILLGFIFFIKHKDKILMTIRKK